MKVKVCGLRLVEDARLALSLGATHLGVVLAPDSPRCATLDEARAIVALTDAFADPRTGARAESVLVFRDQSEAEVAAAAGAVSARCVQVHGANARSIAMLRAHGLRVLPVAMCGVDACALPNLPVSPTATEPGILDCGRGGSGQRFPWQLLGDRAPQHVFVAGGIDPTNVDDLLSRQPFGIDLSRGVEAAPGVKDPKKLRALFERLQLHSPTSRA